MRGNRPNYGVAPIPSGYDSAGRLLLTALRSGAGSTLNSHTYQYNGAGQRQRNTLADNTYTTYAYDDDGQLTNSLGYTSGGSPIAAEQLGFGYDAGWNMSGRSVNGTVTSYGVDDRNALSSGGSDPPYSYDGNGNLTSKGTGSGTTQYVYDDENRLTRLTYGSSYKTEYTYDGLGRLRVRTEYLYSAGWYVSSTTRYIYDGMRVVQERNASNTPLVGYTRGKDLSGTLEGAGGIGGLLARSSGYSSGSWPTHHFYHADGNGNVTRLVTTTLTTAASYKYDPYGRTISSTDTIGNVYRFSSKEVNLNSGIYYYGYRFYEPTLQRWLNRDPAEELGGINLYRFCLGNPQLTVDYYGMFPITIPLLKTVWEGACAKYAFDKAITWNPPNDSHEHKKHCLVGCLMNKCQLGFSMGDLIGQPLKEVLWGIWKKGWPWNWDWQEAFKDTLATYQGHINGWDLLGDCREDCDCPELGS